MNFLIKHQRILNQFGIRQISLVICVNFTKEMCIWVFYKATCIPIIAPWLRGHRLRSYSLSAWMQFLQASMPILCLARQIEFQHWASPYINWFSRIALYLEWSEYDMIPIEAIQIATLVIDSSEPYKTSLFENSCWQKQV